MSQYEVIGKSRVYRPNLTHLQKAWRQNKLTLVLGAGLSQPYGIPGWNELVLNFLITKADRDGWRGFYPHFRKALSEWMMDQFSFSPIALARLFIKEAADRETFTEQLRTKLYREVPSATARPRRKRTALDGVVDLVKRTRASGQSLAGIITLNYDDLLEERLEAEGISCSPVVGSQSDGQDGLPIIHAHGFLPRTGEIPDQRLVLTESDYHEVMSSAFHWATLTLGWHFRQNNVLFIGVSLVDPSIRRLLDGCKPPGDRRAHVIFRKDYELVGDQLDEAVRDIKAKAAEYGERMERTEKKLPSELNEIMGQVCQKAHDYDRQMLRSIGVRPLWLQSYDDIAPILDRIGGER